MRISDWSSDVCSSDLADQRSLLSAVIEEEGSMKEQFQQLIAAWARGDVTALEELADDELKANPNVRKVLLTSRNARWADWIAKRMDTPGTVFVAVGAGHLAGDESVQHMRSEEHTSELKSLMRNSYA